MTLDELRERIKNELVLHEGNVADWQWARTGLPAEATELGVTDFLRLVDDVSRPLNAQLGKILDLQTLIRKVALAHRKELSDVQVGGFALDAERLGLSRSFVTEQWVPHLMAQLPDVSAPEPASTVEPPAPDKTAPPAGVLAETPETMHRKVHDILDDYKEHIPAPAIRALFRAINFEEKALADAVLAYLTANFYASEKEPQGATLREKLISTDWRHLVWWDRPAQPVVPPVPPPIQFNTPASVPVPPAPATSSSGWRDFLVALLIAGGLIGFVVVLIRSGGSSIDKGRKRTPTERVEAENTEKQPAKRTQSRRKPKRETMPKPQQELDRKPTATAPVSPREEPYDELLDDVGQYGERAGQKDGQWGLWRKGRWMILPVYDEIEVYKEGRARVTVNGNSYDIDRNGDRIR